ncbi:glutamate-rich protein 2 isoform X1 [Phyllopteryx taeniolatus]|uniref:glutamate-rich protein 2 isoform X1 n=1 Tax=Phyllopteryx taeniolatus TaxID=161469 RepID=UPI002AD56E6B|nr:glutamate-rich protein 2 isoform X1 [Phyllopteryx taeniolatus]XP_061653727.1 glutamate-rich protein 2 isoform X1 [Phyllopteryx taeniolatus]XP_061653728.1 glutamate-rich protein 2 isoform X1 [Phyllopteryx taeniolatus]XP_061653729.1 glutamate-rich protein 2 isoform X1 [Phyllopteryx taeniolatus]XP_061653730.1 glutamate-rich protein 2 isoform X1 [Phyllopteryx taeniolatus]
MSSMSTGKRVEGRALRAAEEPRKLNVTSAHAARPPAEATPGEENEADADEDLDVPVQVKMEFLRALTAGDLRLAQRLCRTILIYEPQHPEASEFLPLIRKKLLQGKDRTSSRKWRFARRRLFFLAEQRAERHGARRDTDDEDGDEDSGSHEESSDNSDCLSSPSDEDAESAEEKPAD